MPDANATRWRNLGAELIRRRVDLGYNKRTDLGRTVGSPAYSVLTDIEMARRTNFDATMIARLERTYKLAYGAIDRFLAGETRTLEPAEERAGDRDDRVRSERELDELRHHVRSALLLADRLSGRCQGGRDEARSAVG